MIKIMQQLLIVAAIVYLAGCASYTNWQPVVDPYNDPNAARISQDLYECKQLASQSSGGTATQTATGAGVGALVGAAGGAVAGALAGNPGIGAAIGASAGAFGGGGYQGMSAEARYKNAYNQCMAGRGHNVIR